VKRAKALTSGSQVKVATVIGFPFGYSAVEAKLAETILAMVDGTDELEMVINLLALKNSDWQYLAKEINTILPVTRNKAKPLKVIIETGILTSREIITCCDIYGAAAVNFIQTSTGYAERSATVEAVKLMRQHLAEAVQIKASAGIDSYKFAAELVEAGATRLGCSNSVQIVKAPVKGMME
jgi:deoxyribose-phosphate aldolase